MTEKWENKPISCENRPYRLFQDTHTQCPEHQVGQLAREGSLYRPHIIRVVVNNIGKGTGARVGHEHTHDVFHIIIPSMGCATVKHNGTVKRIGVGTLLAISPGEPHCFMTDMEACCFTALTFEYLNVDDGAPFAAGFSDLLKGITGMHFSIPDGVLQVPDYALEEVHRLAFDMVRQAEDAPLESASCLVQLLLKCVSACKGDAHILHPDPRLDEIHDELRKHFRTHLDVGRLATQAAMSRRTLTRRFKDRFGISIKQLQIRLRMDAASLMLKTTNLQVQEVAEEIGYSDLYQFTSAFSRYWGQSPTTFRRGLMKDVEH